MELFDRYYTQAIRLLARRPRSAKEIKDNLIKKKASPTVISAVLKKLHKQKFQDDLEFALWWVEQRSRFKVKSDLFIKGELRLKGISDDIIDEAIQNASGERKKDYEKALSIAGKRYQRLKSLPKEEQFSKLFGFLSRRGFDYETIKRVIDDIWQKSYNTDNT